MCNLHMNKNIVGSALVFTVKILGHRAAIISRFRLEKIFVNWCTHSKNYFQSPEISSGVL